MRIRDLLNPWAVIAYVVPLLVGDPFADPCVARQIAAGDLAA